MIRFSHACWTRHRFWVGLFVLILVVGIAHDTPAPASPRAAAGLRSYRPKTALPQVEPAPPLLSGLSGVHPLVLASFQVLVSLTALVAFSIEEEAA